MAGHSYHPAVTRRPSSRLLSTLVGVIIVAGGAVGGMALPGAAPAAAQEEPSAEQQLAERYAPVMVLKAQSEECDPDGEPYAPAAVDVVLDNPQVVLRQVGPGAPVVSVAPSAQDVSDAGEGLYLDFPGDALRPGCLYEQDYRRYSAGEPFVVYAHVAGEDHEPGRLALQYWFFWYYNDWVNKHEGDWEGIQLVFEADTAAEALSSEPVSVSYAQHEGGERARWDSAKLQRRGDHPVVYSSVGSHASYFGSALYLGRRGSEGFGCDDTDGPSHTIVPSVILLPDAVDDPSDPLAWLSFSGGWGERRSGPFSGPTGPAQKDRWSEPLTWQDGLRDDSVTVPAGDQVGDDVVSLFCGAVERGSSLLIDLQTSPLKTIAILAVLALATVWLARRTVWSPVEPSPIRTRRSLGQIIAGALLLYRRYPGPMLVAGLLYLPFGAVGALLHAGLTALGPVAAFREAGHDETGAALVGVGAGALASGLGFSLVAAVVAAMLVRHENRQVVAARSLMATVGPALRPVAWSAMILLTVAVLLTVTIVGIPIAIYLVVRWALFPQVAVLEGRSGLGSLGRSYRLASGQWWRTAMAMASLYGIVVVVGLGVGLVVLVVAAAVPLWAFNVVTAVVFALLTPVAAAGLTLLYSDLVSRHGGDEPVPAAPEVLPTAR